MKYVSHSDLRDTQWGIWQLDNGKYDNESCTRAILLDIRAELKRLNGILHCGNFLNIPTKLERIARNTTKPRKKRRLKAATS